MDALTNEVVKLVFAVAAPVLATVLTMLLMKLLKKVGLQVDAEKQARLEKVAQDAILRAEEFAAERVKRNLPAVSGSAKLERVLADVVDKVPGVTRDEAVAVVHQELPKVGAGAAASVAGFLRRVQAAATNASR